MGTDERSRERDRERAHELASRLFEGAGDRLPPPDRCLGVADEIAELARLHQPADEEIDVAWAQCLTLATESPDSSCDWLGLLVRIEGVARRHAPPSERIDLCWSRALLNVAALDVSEQVSQLVESVERLAGRHSPRVLAIDVDLVRSLADAVVGVSPPDARNRLLEVAKGVLDAQLAPSPPLDEAFATALRSSTDGDTSVQECLVAADQLERVALRQTPPNAWIDTEWARVLAHAAYEEDDPPRALAFAERAGRIAARHDGDVDLPWVAALLAAQNPLSDVEALLSIADRIDEIAAARDPSEPQLERGLALALRKAGQHADSVAALVRIADRLQIVAERVPLPDPHLDREWAFVLFRATAYTEVFAETLELARRVGAIAGRHAFPHPHVDECWADSLCNAVHDAQDLEAACAVADLVVDIAARHDPPCPPLDLLVIKSFRIAQGHAPPGQPRRDVLARAEPFVARDRHPDLACEREWANALVDVAHSSRDPDWTLSIADELEQLAARREAPDVAIDILLARALVHATLDEQPVDRALAVAARLERVARRHDPPDDEIELRWAWAVHNANVFETDHERRLEIADRIARIAVRRPERHLDVDRVLAQALLNACWSDSSAAQLHVVCSRIREIADLHEPFDEELDATLVRALQREALAHDDPGEVDTCAQLIGDVAHRHAAPVPQIEESWAETVHVAADRWRVPAMRIERAEKLARIVARSDPPLPDVVECLGNVVSDLLSVAAIGRDADLRTRLDRLRRDAETRLDAYLLGSETVDVSEREGEERSQRTRDLRRLRARLRQIEPLDSVDWDVSAWSSDEQPPTT